jgi:Zn-dependent peptidase ImmA (M78 family)
MQLRDFWKAESKALQVLEDLKIDSLPVDPFSVAEREGIVCEQIRSTKPGVSGCLAKSADQFGIFYTGFFPNEGFLRFTVAHELGHYFLERHYEHLFATGDAHHESVSGFVSDDPFEGEADAFAAALLMPEGLFKRAADRITPGLKAIENLAELCRTSLTATSIRYALLSDDPIAVICSEQDRVQFAFLSKPLKERRGLTWIKKNSIVPRETATAEFNKTASNVLQARRVTSRSTLDCWFDCGGTLEIADEVVGLGRYGRTLTVLSAELPPEQDETEDDVEENEPENMLPSDRWRQPRED